jgi:hypothetical protein
MPRANLVFASLVFVQYNHLTNMSRIGACFSPSKLCCGCHIIPRVRRIHINVSLHPPHLYQFFTLAPSCGHRNIFMSREVKRSVVWLDLEEKPKRPKGSSQTLSKSSLSTSQAPPSPGPWIDLASVASSNGEDHESDHTADDSFDSMSVYTPSTTWEYAAGYEKGALAYGHYAGSQTFAGKAMSVVSIESNIVYPNTVRLILITISLSLSLFLIAMDRTIVAAAMFFPSSPF